YGLERAQDRERLLARVERRGQREEVLGERELALVRLLHEQLRLREQPGAQLLMTAGDELDLELDARESQLAGERRRERGEEAARLVGLPPARAGGGQPETGLQRRPPLARPPPRPGRG